MNARVKQTTEQGLTVYLVFIAEILKIFYVSDMSQVQASKVLEEICNYIRRLNRDADDLSDRLSQLLESNDINAVDIETIRRLLPQ